MLWPPFIIKRIHDSNRRKKNIWKLLATVLEAKLEREMKISSGENCFRSKDIENTCEL